jgi:hypothetical protein
MTASFWHVCDCETAWIDNDPRPTPCPSCGTATPIDALGKLFSPVGGAYSEPCPSFNGTHTP